MIDKLDFVKQLSKCMPRQNILTETEQLQVYACDALSAYQCMPWLVLLPENENQIKAVLKLCHRNRIPVIARGAGTGLSGGALPQQNSVLLSLGKLNAIVDIDIPNRQAVVQPGVRNLSISQAVAPYGLYYAPDPSSQIACSIGGNVAENSGGVHCLKYGLTTHNLVSMRIVTMDGEILTLGSRGLDGPGYDLMALLTGSEGLLAVIVEVTVKLLPLPESTQVLMAAFDTIETAADAVAGLIGAGLIPAGLEMMDKATIKAAEDFVNAGYPLDVAAILLCEVDGSEAQVSDEMAKAHQLLNNYGAVSITVAEDEKQRQRMWLGRKSAFPAVGRISPDYYCMDGTIPKRQLARVLGGIAALSKQYGLDVANVFHAGDGKLHPLILYNSDQPGEWQKAEQLGGDILELCIQAGGTITGEHGVGVEKINQMCLQFNSAELQQFHAVKSAFDAEALLNPGKAVPSLKRCAEFGAMHVHRGQLPFPELDRF